MNVLLSVERALLADVARASTSLKSVDDQTMKGLALFYGYDILHHAIQLLKHTNRLALYHSPANDHPRRLYQFHASRNQVSVYTLSTSNFCTCSFYQEHVLVLEDYFACPHNLAIKLHERLYADNGEMEIESFDVSHEYLIDKMNKLFEQSSESFQ